MPGLRFGDCFDIHVVVLLVYRRELQTTKNTCYNHTFHMRKPLSVGCVSLRLYLGKAFEKKLPVTWSWVRVFAGHSGFLHYTQIGNHDLVAIWQNKVMINTIQKLMWERWNALIYLEVSDFKTLGFFIILCKADVFIAFQQHRISNNTNQENDQW